MSEAEIAQVVRLLSVAIIPVLFGIALHEAAHGWVAARFGDRTAELLGRVTANPLKHIDPVGTVLVPLLLAFTTGTPFGWAKPVPVNARNLRDPKRHMIVVAAAGPAANILMGAAWAAVFAVAYYAGSGWGGLRQFLLNMGQFGIQFNALLAVFNLLPIPPLDGGRVVRGLVPESIGRTLDRVEPWGLILVMGLLVVGVLGRVVWPVAQWLADFLFSLTGA
jgi:Zn-dependent protease